MKKAQNLGIGRIGLILIVFLGNLLVNLNNNKTGNAFAEQTKEDKDKTNSKTKIPEVGYVIKGRSVCVSKRGGGYAIYVGNIDGSNYRRITHISLSKKIKTPSESYKEKIPIIFKGSSPQWSSDGKKIAFISSLFGKVYYRDHYINKELGVKDIWVMSPDGTNLKQITHFDNCSTFRWSPDSKKILFYHGRTYKWPYPKRPVTLPNGKKYSGTTSQPEIRVVDVNGGKIYTIYKFDINWSPHDLKNVRWSLDSKKIVSCLRGDIWIIKADGKGRKKITQGGGCRNIFWWPDGKITFQRERENWVMSPDGTNQQAITEGYNIVKKTGSRCPFRIFRGQEMYSEYAVPGRLSPDGRKFLFHDRQLREGFWIKGIKNNKICKVATKIVGNFHWEE